MPLTIRKQTDGGGEKVTVDRRLYLTADRERVVEEGDPDAAFLYAAAGRRVPREEFERLGGIIEDAEPEVKEDAAYEDKEDAEAEDKAEVGPDYDSMTVNELKNELQALGLPVSGRKADLIARLKES